MSNVTDAEWTEFKKKFDKSYNDTAEDKMRRDIYQKSKVRIEEHNKKFEVGGVTWKMDINHLADETPEEMAKRCGRKLPPTAT